MNRNTSTLSGAVARTVAGKAANQLAPDVQVVSEQPYAARAERRHARTQNGAVLNIPKAKQAPALNTPYRRTAAA